ncbi:flavin reductase [Ructibacterium gallinarum]|uniref:Flavin reductase n=1 Tax=Ructibacterium gallinarum TaxID=2779355 RepID=A0A9D5M459_9FIRM|nr:flavin reductase [Ructibacterium gallinarum]MBE5040280.1 flavin reductase [Ructibacterium gallinarum]
MDTTVLFDLSYGMYLCGSVDAEGRKAGCIANSVFQITAEPMTVGVSLHKDNYTEACVRHSGYFTVSILSEQIPQEIIAQFGFQSSRTTNKYERLECQMVGSGYPVIKQHVRSWILCRVVQEIDVGTHTLFIGEAEDMGRLQDETPMTYAYYHMYRKGKTAKNAPTYVETPVEQQDQKHYVCEVCGYVFEGSPEEFEALPVDWKCPVCKVGKEKFCLR